MTIPATIFRQYDIRGTVGDQLTPTLAHAIGQAVATIAWERLDRAPRLAVGRDNRPSGASLIAGVAQGIAAAGGTAVTVGEVPTPALYFATHTLDVDGGIQVTGSHNPPEFNGFKMVLAGSSVHGEEIQYLYRLIEESRLRRSSGGKQTANSQVLAAYRAAIVQRNAPLARRFRVVVDCGNGVTSLVAIETLRALGADVVPLFAESDGTFPNHHPDPTVPENLRELQATVMREGAELGIAFDGDGDRIGAVDERGRVVFGDHLLVLFGRDLAHRLGPGHAVIFDVKCSEILPQELRRSGLTPVMWKTGHSLIKQKMKELGAPLAGEMSGHMFFGADWFGFDDALFAAARLLHYVARERGPLSRLLADLPATVSTPELRVDCPDEVKFDIVQRAAAHFAAKYPVSTLDGVRITFADGWGLLRASNTQPVLVLRFEATSEQALAAYRAEVEGWLTRNAAGPIPPPPSFALVSTAARRRWILAGVLSLVAIVLFGGRWAAAETAERAWAAAVPGGQAYVDARTLARVVRAAVLFFATLWGTVQLYLVYRSIGSVQVPRRLGNIEIVEAVPQRLLLVIALGIGLLYGLLLAIGTGDWWLAVAIASEPPRFGVLDPVLGRDVGYYLSGLPWTMRLQNRALLASFSAVVVVGLLYIGIGALRFDGARPVAGPHARSHLGTLLTTLALVLAWGALLDPAEVVAGAQGPLDRAALSVRLPGSTAVVIAALLVAGLNLAWAWRGRPAALAGAWGFLLTIQVVVYVLGPAMVRVGQGREGRGGSGGRAEAELRREALGLATLREEPLPAFPSSRAAAAAVPLWDANDVLTVARHGAKFGRRGTPAAAVLYRAARPTWLVTPAPDADAWQALSPPPTWDEIHRGPWARAGAPLLAIEADVGLTFVPAPVRDSVVWFGAGFREFALASPDTWPALRPSGIPLNGWGRRAALAWALQSPEILDGEHGTLLLWRRNPQDRLARLLPAARFDPAVPVLADGSLWWVSYGYVESALFPSAERSSAVSYLRLGFVGAVRAADGETRVYLARGHDSLSAAWGRIFAPLVRPVAELPHALAAALPFPRRAFDAAAAEIAGAHPDTAAWHGRPDQPFFAPAPDGTGDGEGEGRAQQQLSMWMAQGFETAQPAAFVALLAGKMTADGPALVLWRPAVPSPRPGTLAGSPEVRPGPLRIWPAGGSLFAMQGQFSESVPGTRGTDPALARVYVWWGERIGQGPTRDAALRDLLVQGAAVADTSLVSRWDRARRLAAQADSALERGDLQEFARLYEHLKALLDVGRERARP